MRILINTIFLFYFCKLWPISTCISTIHCLLTVVVYHQRPHYIESTRSHLNSEVKRCTAQIVLRWKTAREVLGCCWFLEFHLNLGTLFAVRAVLKETVKCLETWCFVKKLCIHCLRLYGNTYLEPNLATVKKNRHRRHNIP